MYSIIIDINRITVTASGIEIDRITDTLDWFGRYKEKWFLKNKPNELYNIEKVFTYLEEI